VPASAEPSVASQPTMQPAPLQRHVELESQQTTQTCAVPQSTKQWPPFEQLTEQAPD
jgi:hypothetical protein